MAKHTPFDDDGRDILDAGEVRFEFGATEDEAMEKIHADVGELIASTGPSDG